MRHGNGGEMLRDRVEEGARAVGDEVQRTYFRVRDRAADVGGRAVGFTKDHPLAIIGSLAAGVGIGLLIARMVRR
ncbi:MAG TPA: hypothetical protein VKB80_01915 [Kofleriaceae bacterium]|nr:hypothetical protein [Kofleriaceae bacterium]